MCDLFISLQLQKLDVKTLGLYLDAFRCSLHAQVCRRGALAGDLFPVRRLSSVNVYDTVRVLNTSRGVL